MALLLPFLAFLFCVGVDFCRAFHTAQVIDSCARSAALYASGTVLAGPDTTPSDAAVQAAVADGAGLNPPLQAQDVTVTTGSSATTVVVTYQLTMFTGYACLTDALTISRTVTMSLAPKPPWEGP
jgi:hypothetical protein